MFKFNKVYIYLTGKVKNLVFTFTSSVSVEYGLIPNEAITSKTVQNLIELTKYGTVENIMENSLFQEALNNDLIKAYNEFGDKIDIKYIKYIEVFNNTLLEAGSKGVYNPEKNTFEPLPEYDLSLYQLRNEKDQPNGYAGLDISGKLSLSSIPEGVMNLDEILEYSDSSLFPLTGALDKYYLALDTNYLYKWTGSQYTFVGANPTSYQLKSEKNQVNGYLGLDLYGHVEAPLFFSNKKKIRWFMNLVAGQEGLTNTGQTAITQFVGTNQSSYKNGNNSGCFSKTYTLPSNSSNYCGLQSSGGVYINGNGSFFGEILVSFKNSGATSSHTFLVGIGNGLFDSTETFGGDGIFLTYNPTLNSGNFRVLKAIASVPSYTNLNISITQNEAVLYSFFYDSTLNTCDIYINKQLIFTLTNINFPIGNNYFRSTVNLASNSTTETLVRRFSLFNMAYEGEIK